MVDRQSELDLPPPPRKTNGPVRKKARFAGLSRSQLFAGLFVAIALIWSMWVTKRLLTPPGDHLVAARLSNIVGEYVQAQARSSAPPAQVEAEMKAFMAALDGELQKRSAQGDVVLVGEAVLTKNVPDITDGLRRAVYAAGIRLPAPASAQRQQPMQQSLAPAVVPNLPPDPSTEPFQGFDPMTAGADVPAQYPAQPVTGRPTPSVSTFGGPGDGNGQ
jgi:hypothetical protein